MEQYRPDAFYTDVLALPIRPEEEIELGALVGPKGVNIDFSLDCVIYFPGLTASKHHFETCLTSPLLSRFTGLAIDPPGICDSTLLHPDNYSYRLEQQAVLVNEALDFFIDRGIAKSLVFVAHSWGEALALEALRQKKRELTHYVSVSGGVTGGDLENTEQYLLPEFIEALMPSMLMQTSPTISGEDPSPREKTLARRILRESIASFVEGIEPLTEVFRGLQCPKCFIHGSNDICQGGQGFDDIISIQSAGHNVITDASESFNRVLAEVLQRR